MHYVGGVAQAHRATWVPIQTALTARHATLDLRARVPLPSAFVALWLALGGFGASHWHLDFPCPLTIYSLQKPKQEKNTSPAYHIRPFVNVLCGPPNLEISVRPQCDAATRLKITVGSRGESQGGLHRHNQLLINHSNETIYFLSTECGHSKVANLSVDLRPPARTR